MFLKLKIFMRIPYASAGPPPRTVARGARRTWNPLVTLALAVACSSESRPPAPPAPAPSPLGVADAAAPSDANIDVFGELRTRGYAKAVAVIEQRVAQQKRKMKLTAEQGVAAATALIELDRDVVRDLNTVMPRSTVELARAVRERGVSVDEAEAIARYLLRVVQALSLDRLPTFDENHSHVIGREWPDIDYTGEGMTWQSQRADWEPEGVISFKRASFIHAYFIGAEQLPHWKRVYRPRGSMRDVEAP